MENKIFAEVYGCSANLSDFEIGLGLLTKGGYKIVDDVNDSDLNIIFTCVVKTPTADRMVHRIKELTKSNKPLIVAGCMPKTERRIVEKIKLRNNQKWLNWEGEVLIDEVGRKGGLIGRNFAYKSVLTKGKLGTFRKVKIKSIRPTYLIGED